jgi:hypothetical protein
MQRATIIALLCLSSTAFAQPPHEERRGPPQEAFDACKGKKEGAEAEATSPRGDMIKGSCRMVLIPSRPPGGERERGATPPKK